MASGEIASTVQIVSVVVGVVISVLSFNDARKRAAAASELESAKPFLDLRQKLYVEAVHAAAVLVNQETHTADEIKIAKARFRDLYVAELSMVEDPAVEAKMKELATRIDSELVPLKDARKAAYDLSHALRDSFTKTYKIPN
jgi:uncharacterized membrane-anchored protein YhcB (DUF1043 family)